MAPRGASRAYTVVIAVLVIACVYWFGRASSPGQRPGMRPAGDPGPPAASTSGAGGPPRGIAAPANPRGFASRARLEEHFAKHGREFGDVTPEEYLRLAQGLRDAPSGGDIEEVIRDNGDVARFDRASGAFGVFEPDGTVRTFFKPNDSEAYFRRQARHHE